MNKVILNRICIEKFKQIAPAEYRECQRLASPPRLKDYQAIPDIIKFVVSQGYENNSINASLIVGVIFSLIAPYKIYYQNVRLPLGLRGLIARELGYVSPEMVNYHANLLPTYTKGRWLKKIESLADLYLNTISKADEKY